MSVDVPVKHTASFGIDRAILACQTDLDTMHAYDVYCNRSMVHLRIPTLARCYRGYTVSIDRMSYRRIVSTLLLLLQKPTDPTYPLFGFYLYTQRGKLRPAGAGPFYPLPYGRGGNSFEEKQSQTVVRMTGSTDHPWTVRRHPSCGARLFV